MTTEQQMKEWLDGWFFSFDYRNGTVTSLAVAKNHIPDHKPKMFDPDEEIVRVNGNTHQWDEEQDDFVVARREAGDTFGQIAQQIGLSETAVLKRYKIVCTLRGIKQMPRCHGRPRKFSAEMEDKVVACRKDGMSFADIAALVKLTKTQVYEIYRTYRTRCDKYRSLERQAA